MNDYKITKSTAHEMSGLKDQYLNGLIAPIDGMWASFISMAQHYAILQGEELIGYAVINGEDKMLRFYAGKEFDQEIIFKQLITELKVKGAIVATNELQYLSLCMDNQKSVSVNALLYGLPSETHVEKAIFPKNSEFRLVEMDELQDAVNFAIAAIGAPEEWLRGYYGKLIENKELFSLWQNDMLIATGECRPSHDQKPYADLGMIVAKDQRGRGLATEILRALIYHAKAHGLSPICSTETDNPAAQKAITKAGFKSDMRILDVNFSD